MNEQTLSMRLERVAAHVPQGARLADIGSDHGYLPVALALRGAIEAGVAGEVAQTPYASAQRNVRRNGLQERITIRLADGLEAIQAQDRIPAVSICGMGGDTMCEILERGKARLSGSERLILQPNGGEGELRAWLMANSYRIVAEPGEAVVYSAEELYFGPVLMREKSPAFVTKWQRMLRQKQQTLANFERARDAIAPHKLQDFARQVGWITQVLA